MPGGERRGSFQCEPRPGKELFEFIDRPLPTAGNGEHLQIRHDGRWLVKGAVRQNPFHHQQRLPGLQRHLAVPQNEQALLIIPVVQDAL